MQDSFKENKKNVNTLPTLLQILLTQFHSCRNDERDHKTKCTQDLLCSNVKRTDVVEDDYEIKIKCYTYDKREIK